jgi:ferredoxin
VRVRVDPEACEANGICVSLVPELFSLDEDDQLQIRDGAVPPGLTGQARRAVLSCPKAALTAVEPG